MILTDVNQDGKLDLVTSTASGASIFFGDGRGGLTFQQTLVGLENLSGPIAVSDLNGDGIPDISLMENGTLGIFLGDGGGTFESPFFIGAGPLPWALLTQNLHGQPVGAGLPDLVVPDYSGGVTVLINTTK
jgi:hypothetical protein